MRKLPIKTYPPTASDPGKNWNEIKQLTAMQRHAFTLKTETEKEEDEGGASGGGFMTPLSDQVSAAQLAEVRRLVRDTLITQKLGLDGQELPPDHVPGENGSALSAHPLGFLFSGMNEKLKQQVSVMDKSENELSPELRLRLEHALGRSLKASPKFSPKPSPY